jgi:hypothetical protein
VQETSSLVRAVYRSAHKARLVESLYSDAATTGHLLHDSREDSEHRRPTRKLGPNSRWIHRTAPSEASDRNQSPYQGEQRRKSLSLEQLAEGSPQNVQNDTGKLATSVAKERELSGRYMSDLVTNVSIFKNSPMNTTAKTDPYVSNQAVLRQLNKQVQEENLLQKSIIIIQQSSAHFEESLIRSIQSAWATYDEWLSRSSVTIQGIWRGLADQMNALEADKEWLAFSARSDHLLDPETPLRSSDVIVYPAREDPSVMAVHTGLLERKQRFTRTFKESYYVLTPAGFLHEYESSDALGGKGPIFSLFLPMCTLGPPSTSTSKAHKFHIEGRKDGTGTTKTGGSVRRSLSLSGRSAHAWSFRARSHEEMMEWWNDIRMLCARYLVASETMDRGGPIEAAVRSVGYETEDEETEEGSSVEEEEEDEGLYDDAREAVQEGGVTEPPSYDHDEAVHNYGVSTSFFSH